jgi:hypothetical protein
MLGSVIGLVIVYLFVFQRTNVSAAEESEDKTNVLQTRSPYRNSSIYTAMLWEMVEGRKRGPTAWFVIRGEQ